MRRRSNPDSEPNIRRIDTKTRAKIQTHRDGSRSKARRQSQISASTPALRISFAPDFPALEKRGRKIPRSRLDPSINNAWREQLSGFNLVWVEPQVSIVRSTIERDEFAIRPLGRR